MQGSVYCVPKVGVVARSLKRYTATGEMRRSYVEVKDTFFFPIRVVDTGQLDARI